MTLKEEIEQGIKELLIITPIMKDLHNDINSQQLFLMHDIIPIDIAGHSRHALACADEKEITINEHIS